MISDFTFTKDDAHRFLPWHIGIMVALATLLLALAISLGQWVGGNKGSYDQSINVMIPGTVDRLDDTVERVKIMLKDNPSVQKVTQTSEAELRDLLGPWIGNGDAMTDLSLPVVLEISLKKNAKINEPKILESLRKIAPTIEMDAHQGWADVFASFIRILQGLTMTLVITILAAMALMVTFSARASLHMHGRTVNLLHAIGAEDAYIARQFQYEHFKIGLIAATMGAAAAGAAYILLSFCISRINAPVLPQFDITWSHVTLVLLLPFLCAVITLIATRYSVLGQLKKVL